MGLLLSCLVVVATLAAAPSVSGANTAVLRATPLYPASLSGQLPLVRLDFTGTVLAASLPPLTMHPALSTRWQQVGPREVQAVATTTPSVGVTYQLVTPTAVRCTTRCAIVATQPRLATVATTTLWVDQLLAEMHYLPVTFQPLQSSTSPSTPVPGVFTWAYPSLPASLQQQWQVGTDNVVLRGALMAFQSDRGLPTTGVADATTWRELITYAANGYVNPAAYNYVSVSMTSPETLTLYSNGRTIFHTLVNTGISVSPTATGTYPVYLRYTSQTMSGTNPNGTHYSDPGIPWVSYFNGGDALHGFIRATYGWPQSLGCVEMPFAAAHTVWPYTPIGTLVTVHS